MAHGPRALFDNKAWVCDRRTAWPARGQIGKHGSTATHHRLFLSHHHHHHQPTSFPPPPPLSSTTTTFHMATPSQVSTMPLRRRHRRALHPRHVDDTDINHAPHVASTTPLHATSMTTLLSPTPTPRRRHRHQPHPP